MKKNKMTKQKQKPTNEECDYWKKHLPKAVGIHTDIKKVKEERSLECLGIIAPEMKPSHSSPTLNNTEISRTNRIVDTSNNELKELKEIRDYYKGKDIVKADRLLISTAKNNFEQGRLSERERILKIIDKVLVENYETTLKQFKKKLKQEIVKPESK